MTDHFSFFGMTPAFEIDQKALRSKFLENSRNYHPDFAKAKGLDPEEAMERSTQNNSAFKVLSNTLKRTEHVLQLKAVLGEGKEELPMEFLMEMMELNEAIAELEFDESEEAKAKILKDYLNWKNKVDLGLDEMRSRYDNTGDEESLEGVKDFYLKNKYLLRIKESNGIFAAL